MNTDVIRILLVEDSPSDADILQGSLRQTHAGKFEFSWVESLEDGLARLGQETYDVLLLDLNLPDSSGPETFRRAQNAAPGMPVVVLTGSHDEAIGLAAVREGVQEYLIKGETDGRQIARAIRYAIERKQFLEQQRRSQEALLRSKEEWERTFDSVPDLIAILDNQHRIVRANRAMAQRLGVAPGQCVGLNCFACVHGTDRPPEFCPHTRTLADGQEHIEEIHEDKLGGDFLVSTTPLRDEHGRMVGSAHVARDITERKRTEERIRHQNAVLAGINRILSEALTCDSEEELGRACLTVAQEVTGSGFGFIGEINAEGRLDDISISDTGWEACRIPRGPGQKLGGFQVHGIYGRVLIDGKGFFTNDPQHHPDRVGLPEGHPPLNAFLGVPLKHDGKTIGMIAMANRVGGYRPQDLEALEALALGVVQVFMRKRAERAVRASEERLRQAQKMESIGLLAGGVAHDFNNLLASVMGNASLLREEVSEEKLEKVEAIIRASERAADLTRQLLAYAGKGRVVVAIHDFSHIVRDMTDLLRASIPKKVSLKLALAPDLPGVEADRGQLQQIIMNLVLNGAEAIGPDRPGTLTVRVGAREVSASGSVSPTRLRAGCWRLGATSGSKSRIRVPAWTKQRV